MAPIEFLYLETGALPIKSVITSRRLNYLKHIHMQSEHELIKRIFSAQREDPKKGDWWLMVKDDMETFNIDENEIITKNKAQTKKYVKEKVYQKTFENLKNVQKTHSKIKDIQYDKFKKQEYLTNKSFSYNGASMLFALRSKTVKDIKCDMKSFSQNDKMCPLCLKTEDTQEHCMECPKLNIYNTSSTIKSNTTTYSRKVNGSKRRSQVFSSASSRPGKA